MQGVRLTAFVVSVFLACSVCATAFAQFNPDGSRSMIGPNGEVFEGERAPSNEPLGLGAVPQQERFDIDCDPDIDVCVDPNAQPVYDDGYDPNAYRQFESALQPYGTWSQDPAYGEVWTPSPDYVGNDFAPYETSGQWVASDDYGMAWASDYEWGWAPFHYGRWLFLSGCGGWSWIPGTQWGPAWVDWRYGGGYAGWAPLAPAGVIVPAPSRSLGVRSPWHFAVASELFRRNPTLVPSHIAPAVFARTVPVHNVGTVSLNGVSTRIALGPPLSKIARDLGRPVPALALKSTSPGSLPRPAIVARAGVSLGQRSYIQAVGPVARSGGSLQTRPGVAAPNLGAPPRYESTASTYRAPQQNYPQPIYRGPQPTYPAYRSQAPQSYPQPSSRAPAQSYSRESYHAPAYQPPAYQQPVYQPSYQAPARAYAQPTYQPSYQAPARAYTQPAYQQPAYQAPAQERSYAQPAYQAPARAAPAAVSRPASSPARRR